MHLNFKIISLALSIIAFKLLWNVNGQSTVIGDKSYYVLTGRRYNWFRAYQTCVQLGMSLASIESETELKGLNDFLYAQSILANNFWLSGTNLADKEQYSWASTGKPLSYTKWALNQPGILANRCIYTSFNTGWLADDCYASKNFICSKPLVSTCGSSGSCLKLAF